MFRRRIKRKERKRKEKEQQKDLPSSVSEQMQSVTNPILQLLGTRIHFEVVQQ